MTGSLQLGAGRGDFRHRIDPVQPTGQFVQSGLEFAHRLSGQTIPLEGQQPADDAVLVDRLTNRPARQPAPDSAEELHHQTSPNRLVNGQKTTRARPTTFSRGKSPQARPSKLFRVLSPNAR